MGLLVKRNLHGNFEVFWDNFAHQFVPVRIIPNQVVKAKRDRKKYVGDEVEECRDTSALHYSCPFEKVSKRLKC